MAEVEVVRVEKKFPGVWIDVRTLCSTDDLQSWKIGVARGHHRHAMMNPRLPIKDGVERSVVVVRALYHDGVYVHDRFSAIINPGKENLSNAGFCQAFVGVPVDMMASGESSEQAMARWLEETEAWTEKVHYFESWVPGAMAGWGIRWGACIETLAIEETRRNASRGTRNVTWKGVEYRVPTFEETAAMVGINERRSEDAMMAVHWRIHD